MGDGCNSCHLGGGYSAVFRFATWASVWEPILVAGGGGAGCSYSMCRVEPGKGISPGGCGVFSPKGQDATGTYGNGGGGGWIGGLSSSYRFGMSNSGTEQSAGGTSCAPGCVSSTVVSLSGTTTAAPFGNSPFYLPGFGGPSQPGLVVLAWQGPNPSPTGTPARTATPTISPSNPATATPTGTRTAGVSATVTASASGSPYCNTGVFRTFPDHDLVGARVGVSFVATERECQLACCTTPRCVGYVFETVQLLRGGSTAACFLDGNVTQLMPSSLMSSGVLASFYPS